MDLELMKPQRVYANCVRSPIPYSLQKEESIITLTVRKISYSANLFIVKYSPLLDKLSQQSCSLSPLSIAFKNEVRRMAIVPFPINLYHPYSTEPVV